MNVTFKEIGAMLAQFQRAATSTRDKCLANSEVGYDERRADDVAQAHGRLEAVQLMQAKLAELQAEAGNEREVDAEAFLRSFSAEEAESKRIFGQRASGKFFTLLGQIDAYADVSTVLRGWAGLQ